MIRPGSVSDGYHTFDELYEHRHALYIALMQSNKDVSWYSNVHSDGTVMDNWLLAGMDLPTGQISYHIPARMVDRLEGIKRLQIAPAWDGHTSEDVVDRLIDWSKEKGNENTFNINPTCSCTVCSCSK